MGVKLIRKVAGIVPVLSAVRGFEYQAILTGYEGMVGIDELEVVEDGVFVE